ncbi:hypothetical protein BAY61_11860 [Prauserella marina]|uniref:Uncharacterized protein n=1 Tax=Prauserella marina TaxID=530584 RepID=A0A222VNS6_9PSEU|nr:hypothetical protein [Prauserella marina]ASR35575.1 hypothetical protein BAY61_11860 [Prauserella marina]PWV84571.1 hypothetical protein DES30_101588 [Prauserella marina]SDC18889.1 hypothetical protein SAMN05421630_101748 [Prauserella marina]
MNKSSHRGRGRAAVLALLLAAAAAAPTATAHAAGATVHVSPGTADPDYATVVDVRGSGFQSVQGGHGGVYVLFGWVSDPAGGWQPSQGGAAGSTYKYVQDSESKNNNGFQRYLAFPGSDTGDSANGVVAADGTWATQLVIPGARFPAVDRAGNTTQVDCTQVRCGVITIGAHGVVSPDNETFTPIDFAAPGQAAPEPEPSSERSETTSVKPPAKPVVKAENTETTAGEDVEVTGTGFRPGENVAVTLHSEPVSLPQARAGEDGKFSYTATIPRDTEAGEHRLVFAGEQSTVEISVELSVRASPVQAPSTSQAAPEPRAQETGEKGNALLIAVLVGGAILLVVAAVAIVVRSRRGTRENEGN